MAFDAVQRPTASGVFDRHRAQWETEDIGVELGVAQNEILIMQGHMGKYLGEAQDTFNAKAMFATEEEKAAVA